MFEFKQRLFPKSGEKLFKEHAVAQCFRCCKVGGAGGDAGRDLSMVAGSKNRAYILELIVNPDVKIAEGFQMAMITTKKGDLVAGMVKSETADALMLQVPGAELVNAAKVDIDKRDSAPSGMPALGRISYECVHHSRILRA